MGNFTTLRLENETLSEMQAGVHCITLTVTNFLGKSSDTQDPAELTIEKLASALSPPAVQTSTPSHTTIGAGVTLAATVDANSVCAGEQAEYQWRCLSEGCPLLGGPNATDDYVPSVAKVLTPSDLVGRVAPGAELDFKLSARMRNADGDTSASVKITQAICFNGDSLVAGITQDSPSGNISRGREDALVFIATGLDPSDLSNSDQPIRFSFKCERPDGISPCFQEADDSSYYSGAVDGNEYSLDVSKFVGPDPEDSDNDNTFIISVTISKGSGDLLRTDTSTRFIRLRAAAEVTVSARVNQDCGELCTGIALSSEPLSLAAVITEIVNADDPEALREQASYRWTTNGAPLLGRHLLVRDTADKLDEEVDEASITVNAFEADSNSSIITRSGELFIQCTVAFGDRSDVPSSAAATSTSLVGPPVCASDSCLQLEPTTSQVPEISFRAEVTGGFSSPDPLLFEFGFKAGDDLQVQQTGLERSVTLQALYGVNEYMVYVVAINTVTGARSAASTALFNLTEYKPEGETCEAQQADYEEALEERSEETADFERLENTGDNRAIFDGFKSAVGLVNSNANPPSIYLCKNSTSDGSRRRLLDQHTLFEQKTLDGLNALLGTLVDEKGEIVGTVADAKGFLESIQSAFESQEPTLE